MGWVEHRYGQAIISTYDFLLDFCSESIDKGYSFARNLRGNLIEEIDDGSSIGEDNPVFPHMISS